MPLLKRQPFIPKEPPAGLKNNDEVFYCKVTNEVFTDYQEFFERTILCNSLVWSCSLTGRSGMTYQEAIESEEKARKQLGKFPETLLRPILFLVSLNRDIGLSEMVDNIHSFVKDRYFIGETIELLQENKRKSCRVIKVMAPVANNSKVNGHGASGKVDPNEVICLDSESDEEPVKAASPGKKDQQIVDADLFQYVVQETEKPNVFIVKAKQICRKKGLLSHEKCKTLLKEFCHVAADGCWKVKAKFVRKYTLGNAQFTDFFSGAVPIFRTTSKSPNKKKSEMSTSASRSSLISAEDAAIKKAKEEHKAKNKMSPKEKDKAKKEHNNRPTSKTTSEVPQAPPLSPLPEMTLEQWEEMRNRLLKEREMQRNMKEEEKRKKREAEKQQKLEERAKEREKRLEEKRQHEEYMKEWSKPRDDLECDDLQPMPNPIPIQCDLPAELFGDAVMIVEFLNNFGSLFDFKKVFPNGIVIGDIVKAVTETGISDMLSDLLTFLLTSVFSLQEQEQEEGEDDEQEKDKAVGQQRIPEYFDKVEMISEQIEMSKQVTRNIQRSFGHSLRSLQLESFTLTEILRLHLLMSGSQANEANRRFRYQERGAFSAYDDAGVEFRQQEPGIMKTLNECSVFELSAADKLKLFLALIHQLLTYCSCRDMIDDSFEKVKQLRSELRALQGGEQRREREWAAYKYKKLLEERAKKKEDKAESEEREHDAETGEKKIGKPAPEDKKRKGDLFDPFALDREERKSQRLREKEDEKELPVENIDWSKISEEDRQRMRERYLMKELDLLDQIDQQQACAALVPLGEDRILRRYWVFRSIGGLFVDDPCAELPVDWKGQIQHLTKDEGEGSDKENINDKSCDVVMSGSGKHENGLSNGIKMGIEELIKTRGKVPWAFYHSSDQLNTLMSVLNRRGFRENQLYSALRERLTILQRTISTCPVNFLTSGVRTGDKSKQNATLMIELSLRDRLLDLEERIYVGGLGAITVNNRIQWRLSIEQDRLSKDYSSASNDDIRADTGSYKTEELLQLAKCLLSIAKGIDSKYIMKPLGEIDRERKRCKQTKVDKKASKRSKKLDDASDSDSDDDSKSNKSGESRPKTTMQYWEESLLGATSIPQIFLHLAVLEDCVLWSRSALKASCRICRRRGDGEKMLLCDSCNLGFHMYCLKPVVKTVPEGDWFCPNCRPKNIAATPRKRRKSTLKEDSDSSNEESEDDEDSSVANDDEIESHNSDDEVSFASDEDTVEKDESHMSDDTENSSPSTSTAQPTKVRITSKFKVKPIDKVKVTSGRSTPTSVTSNKPTAPAKKKIKAQSCSDLKKMVASAETNEMSKGGKRIARQSVGAVSVSKSSKAVKRKSSGISEDDSPVPNKKAITKSRSTSRINNLKEATDLVAELCQRDEAWPFVQPVRRKDAPDYFDIIKTPMDLQSIKNRLNHLEYNDASEVLADIALIFSNCFIYNQPTAQQYVAGQKLQTFFKRRVRELGLKMDSPKKDGGNWKSNSSRKR